ENEETTSVTEKSAMSSPGTRSASASQKIKTPTWQSGRNGQFQGDSASNTTEDATTGNKSQSNTARRTPGKLFGSSIPNKRLSSSLMKRYIQIKKELANKHETAQDLYNEMSQIREKLINMGAKDPGKPETLKLDIGSPKQVAPAEPTIYESANTTIEKLPIGKELLGCLEERLREIPKNLRNICQELLDKQSIFVTFVTSQLIQSTREGNEADQTNSEVSMQLEVHQKDYDNIRSRLDEVQELEEKSISELTKNVQNLIDEYEHSRSKIKQLNAAEAQKELQKQLDSKTEEMQAEKEKNNQTKDRLRQAETQLQKTRTKVRELESHIANEEKTSAEKIQQLQASMKNLDAQMKQKDLAIESKMKDMQKAMKNSEDLVAKVEKQRDSFEARLMELREKMSSKENEAMATIKELSERLNAVTADLGVEKEKRQQVEDAFVELEERYKIVEEKSKELCELAEKNKNFIITEGSHTENEVRLFNELQATRDELAVQKQLNLQLQQEKEEIIAVMHQAASREEDEDSREKLAAELVFKSNELQKLMMQYSELRKVAKNAQEKNGILETQLKEIQTRLHSQSMEHGKAGLNAHAIELQQQVSDLSNNLAEVTQQKDELESVLSQKQLELEQRDYVMREQSKYLKLRDELLNILKGKVQQTNGELSNSDENNEYLEQAIRIPRNWRSQLSREVVDAVRVYCVRIIPRSTSQSALVSQTVAAGGASVAQHGAQKRGSVLVCGIDVCFREGSSRVGVNIEYRVLEEGIEGFSVLWDCIVGIWQVIGELSMRMIC
ncbi:Laminin subunit alpha-1, partial [Eufriesea mexicana]